MEMHKFNFSCAYRLLVGCFLIYFNYYFLCLKTSYASLE